MNDRDRARLLQTLAGVYTYYDRELSEYAASVWLEDLADYPVEAVERAFVAHRRDTERGQWMPKSADILRHLRPADDEAGAVAWARVLDLVRTYGAGSVPPLDDATRRAVDSLGGWGAICRSQERELQHLQRHFVAAFTVFRTRQLRESESPLLAASVDSLLLTLQ